jgi:hypothetical protein
VRNIKQQRKKSMSYLIKRYCILLMIFTSVCILIWLSLFHVTGFVDKHISSNAVSIRDFEASSRAFDGQFLTSERMGFSSSKSSTLSIYSDSNVALGFTIYDSEGSKSFTGNTQTSITKLKISAEPIGNEGFTMSAFESNRLFLGDSISPRFAETLLLWDSVPQAKHYIVAENLNGKQFILTTTSECSFYLESYHNESIYSIIPVFVDSKMDSGIHSNLICEASHTSPVTFVNNKVGWTITSPSAPIKCNIMSIGHTGNLDIANFDEYPTSPYKPNGNEQLTVELKIEITYENGKQEFLQIDKPSFINVWSISEIELISSEMNVDGRGLSGRLCLNEVLCLKSISTGTVNLYETAFPVTTEYSDQELELISGSGNFTALLFLETFDASYATPIERTKLSVTGDLGLGSDIKIGRYSLKSSFSQWFMRDPMILGINFLVLLGLPFAAMPVLEWSPFWRNPRHLTRLKLSVCRLLQIFRKDGGDDEE